MLHTIYASAVQLPMSPEFQRMLSNHFQVSNLLSGAFRLCTDRGELCAPIAPTLNHTHQTYVFAQQRDTFRERPVCSPFIARTLAIHLAIPGTPDCSIPYNTDRKLYEMYFLLYEIHIRPSL